MKLLIGGVVGFFLGMLTTAVLATWAIGSTAGNLLGEWGRMAQHGLDVRLELNRAQIDRITAAAQAFDGKQVPLTKKGDVSIVCPGETAEACDLELTLGKNDGE
jgi:hypothetical protein